VNTYNPPRKNVHLDRLRQRLLGRLRHPSDGCDAGPNVTKTDMQFDFKAPGLLQLVRPSKCCRRGLVVPFCAVGDALTDENTVHLAGRLSLSNHINGAAITEGFTLLTDAEKEHFSLPHGRHTVKGSDLCASSIVSVPWEGLASTAVVTEMPVEEADGVLGGLTASTCGMFHAET
jgi:hypothetical protein